MERLTFEGNFCDIAQCAEIPGGSFCEGRACSQKKTWERLKAYEDTGLTPGEVRSLWGEWNAMMSVLNSIGSYDRIRELAEADKDGRLVVLSKMDDTPAADVAPVRPELRSAVKPLNTNYEKGLKNPVIRDPLTWALFQTWKRMNGGS